MIAYLDTSVVLAARLPFDALHVAAGAAWDAVADYVKPWFWTQELEALQTLRNVSRRRPKLAAPEAFQQVAAELLADVAHQVFQRVAAERLDDRAQVVAAEYGRIAVIGAYDLLHIAAAQQVGSDVFLTGDAAQAAVAQAAGLKVRLVR